MASLDFVKKACDFLKLSKLRARQFFQASLNAFLINSESLSCFTFEEHFLFACKLVNFCGTMIKFFTKLTVKITPPARRSRFRSIVRTTVKPLVERYNITFLSFLTLNKNLVNITLSMKVPEDNSIAYYK